MTYTKAEIKRFLRVAQSGLHGMEYRDVFLRLSDILHEHLRLLDRQAHLGGVFEDLNKGVCALLEDNAVLRADLARLRARGAVDEEAVRLIHFIWGTVFIEAKYDPYNDRAHETATKIFPAIDRLSEKYPKGDA